MEQSDRNGYFQPITNVFVAQSINETLIFIHVIHIIHIILYILCNSIKLAKMSKKKIKVYFNLAYNFVRHIQNKKDIKHFLIQKR